MTNMELKAKLEKVENAKQLIEELKGIEEDSEILAVLKRYGLEISQEALESIQLEDGELDLDALDQVAGGCKCRGWLKRLITGLCEKIFGFECLDCA